MTGEPGGQFCKMPLGRLLASRGKEHHLVPGAFAGVDLVPQRRQHRQLERGAHRQPPLGLVRGQDAVVGNHQEVGGPGKLRQLRDGVLKAAHLGPGRVEEEPLDPALAVEGDLGRHGTFAEDDQELAVFLDDALVLAQQRRELRDDRLHLRHGHLGEKGRGEPSGLDLLGHEPLQRLLGSDGGQRLSAQEDPRRGGEEENKESTARMHR